MAEKLRVVDCELLALQLCAFESQQGLRIHTCDEAVKLAYETLVVLLQFLPELMHEGLHVKLECHHMNW